MSDMKREMAMESLEQRWVIDVIDHLQALIHRNAVDHGWWEGEQNDAEKIALMHSELSEALEAMRGGGGPSQKIPAYSCVEEELADCVIRILDYAGRHGMDLAGAVLAKHEYNLTRPYKHGGKRF